MVAFVVEDGTGLNNATSYVDVAFSDSYLGPSWAPNDAEKEKRLIVATEYFDSRFYKAVQSLKLLNTQSLLFPRMDFYLYDASEPTLITGIPTDLKKAICQYAQLSYDGKLYKEVTTNQSTIKSELVEIPGAVKTQVQYDTVKDDYQYLGFLQPDNLIDKFLKANYGQSKIIRS